MEWAGVRVVRSNYLFWFSTEKPEAVRGSSTECVSALINVKRADTSQHIPRIALSFNGRTADFGSANRGSNPRGATLSRLSFTLYGEYTMYKFILAVAVFGLTACGAKEEAPAVETTVDSAAVAPVADSVTADSTVVAAPTTGEAAK